VTRIVQLLAVVGAVTTDTKTRLAGLEHAVTTPDLLAGLTKTYRPRAEAEGDGTPLQRPPQSKRVQVTVADVLAELATVLTRQYDVTRTLDEAKTRAAADVIVDGRILLAQVTTDHLLYLEGRLAELAAFAAKLPTLDPAEDWTDEGTEPGQRKTVPVDTTSSDATYFNHVLAPPDEHGNPAQVQVMKRDEVVGFWTTVKFSGAMTPAGKRLLLDRLGRLRDAVKFAREEANLAEVADVAEGAAIFGWLLGGVE